MEDEQMNSKRNWNVRDIVFIGVLSSMCTIATTIKVPFGVGAMVHLGSAFLYTAGIIFGGAYAGLAGAIGSGFYDLLMGFSPYTLWSAVIKGIAGLIVGTVAKGLWPEITAKSNTAGKNLIVRAFFACILAALWTLCGYILAWWYVTGSFTIAVGNIPSSLMTSSAGIIVALILGPKLRKVLKR
jgi:uncharacterized membrane protein